MTWILGLLGLSRLKFFLMIGAAAGLLTVISGAYVKGRMDCSYSAEIAKLKKENELLRKGQKLLEEDSKSARSDDEADERLRKKEEENENSIADGQCFTDDESRRLRGLWE